MFIFRFCHGLYLSRRVRWLLYKWPFSVVIVPEPQSGRLYEYSNSPSDEILYRINSSIIEMVARSPETVNSLYSTGVLAEYYFDVPHFRIGLTPVFLAIGYKSDHWLQFDLDTGDVLKSASCLSPYQCYTSKAKESNTGEGSSGKRRSLVLGMSEFHFILWDLATGVAR